MNLLTWLSFLAALGVFMVPINSPLKVTLIGLLCVPGGSHLAIAYHRHQNRLFKEGERVDAVLALEQEIDRLQLELRQLEPEKVKVTDLIRQAAVAQQQLHINQEEYALHIDLEQRKLFTERSRLESEINAQREAAEIELAAQKEIFQAQINAETAKIEAERESWDEERQQREEVREQEFLNYLEGVKGEVLQELAANYESDVQQEVTKRLRSEVDPLLHKIREQESTIKIQQQKIIALDNRLQQLDDIELPSGTGHAELTATKIMLFYKSKGLKLQYKGSQFLGDGTYIFTCLPHRTANLTTEKFTRAIGAQFLLLQHELQLQDMPQLATSSDGLQLLMKPQHLPNWQQQINQTAVIQEAETIDYLPGEIVQYATEIYQDSDSKNYMMRFEPPSQVFDRNSPVGDLERTTIDWYWNWRQRSCGKTNIRNKNELIRLIYGVTPGRNSDQLDHNGQTLRDRLNSILDELGISHRTRK